jgi:hypothetical protein
MIDPYLFFTLDILSDCIAQIENPDVAKKLKKIKHFTSSSVP